VNATRSSIRAIEASIHDAATRCEALSVEILGAKLQDYRRELESLCLAATRQIEAVLLPYASDAVGRAFYRKTAGDFYRYLAEASTAQTRSQWTQRAEKSYRAALALAGREMRQSHPLYLETAVNFSVCLYDLCGDRSGAIAFAERAFNDAVKTVDGLEPGLREEAIILMQLLRDNLVGWGEVMD
jgi:hypothetical protein